MTVATSRKGAARRLRRLACSAALSALVFAATAPVAAHAEDIDIAAQPLESALLELQRSTGATIFANGGLVTGLDAPAVSGDLTVEEALTRLLAGSGLGFEKSASGVFAIVRLEEEPEKLRESRAGEDATPGVRDRIVVTGTNIRGIAPESSPLLVFDREDILESGATTTEQFIRILPQNFGGGSTEYAPFGVPGDDSSSYNNTFGSGANLRGLGSGATLTLLNGHRLAPTSKIGDFVDLSMIPISALERVDVLTDGASSIYGGDAVAGVINFLLRDDFDGAETSVRYGSVTSGEMDEYRISQTLGKNWGGGNVLAVYEYFDRGNLTLADRPDFPRQTLSDGAVIDQDDLFDLLPRQKRDSLLIAANQDVGRALSLSATGMYSNRSTEAHSALGRTSVSVATYDAESELVALSGGASYELTQRWLATLDLTYSKIRNHLSGRTLIPVQVNPGLEDTQSELWTADLTITGDLLTLPGGPVRAAAGGHLRRESFWNENSESGIDREDERDVSAVFAELQIPIVGPDNAVPGVKRLELNLSGRLDDYSDFGTTTNPKIGVLWAPTDGLKLRGTYGTSFAPPPLGRTGDLNRLGIVYPMSYITSALGVEAPEPALADMDYLRATGTAGSLDAETSRTYTFGADYLIERGAHAWTASLNYYDIDFENRLGSTPMPENQSAILAPFIAYDDPDALPPGTVVFYPTADEIAAAVSSFSQPVLFWPGLDSLDNIGVINYAAVVRNLSSTQTSGLDLQLNYAADTDAGRVTAGLSANYILEFTQQATSTTPAVETLNTLRNPVDLQLRSHVGYARGGFSGNLFVNYLDDYQTDSTEDAQAINSWTTVDLSLSYQMQQDKGWLAGTAFNLSVSNLLDEAPPAVPTNGSLRTTGYDQANASPLMRFVAVEFRKAF